MPSDKPVPVRRIPLAPAGMRLAAPCRRPHTARHLPKGRALPAVALNLGEAVPGLSAGTHA
ncbi:hypothetical protein [uncultured Bilophila sp.]|uniref:hypothetical protein n=1 Tax=uncultured Bilophila sp. TaxID=529385 RepID=UPI0025D0B1E2|nr:hypothetical protein [uncultured Bilophila sp.]